jgi:hypothetical protein
MRFPPIEFENFLARLADAKDQVNGILNSSIGCDKLSEATMLLYWHSMFDVLLTMEDPKERVEYATKIKEMFSALNARRAVELKAKNDDEKNPDGQKPLDTQTFTDLQERLKLL